MKVRYFILIIIFLSISTIVIGRRTPRNRYKETAPSIGTRFVKLEVHQKLVKQITELSKTVNLLLVVQSKLLKERKEFNTRIEYLEYYIVPKAIVHDAKEKGEFDKMQAISKEGIISRVIIRVRTNVAKSQGGEQSILP